MAIEFRPNRAMLATCVACALFCGSLTTADGQVDRSSGVVSRYADVLRSFNENFSRAISEKMAEHVLFIATYYDVDPAFVMAIVNQESGWHTKAVSGVGAEGLGQLMPGTAQGLDVIPTDALENLDGTVRYIRRQLRSFASVQPESQRYRLALAAYNAGPGAVEEYHGIPPYRETIAYVAAIMASWQRLQRILPGRALTVQSTISLASRHLYVDLAIPDAAPVAKSVEGVHDVSRESHVVRQSAPRRASPMASDLPVQATTTPLAPNVVATPAAAFDIAAFTGTSVDAACGPGNILNPGSRCGWQALQDRGPRIGLVLDLGTPLRTVEAVTIRFDAAALPNGFEIATSDSPQASVDDWIGIRYCPASARSTQVTCTIGERRPRAMRIVFDGPRANIREIRFLPATPRR